MAEEQELRLADQILERHQTDRRGPAVVELSRLSPIMK